METMDGNSKMTAKEYKHKWYIEHRKETIERAKKRAELHKEEIKEYRHEHYLANKDKYIDKARKFAQENPELLKEYSKRGHKNYRSKEKNIAKEREYQKGYSKTKMGRACKISWAYKMSDKEKGYDTTANISGKWIKENIFSGQKCIYCGEDDWRNLGCDRIDNNKPHTADNVVCSCFKCNSKRGNRYTVEEFIKIWQN